MTRTHLSHYNITQTFPTDANGKQFRTNRFMVFFKGSKGALLRFAQAHGLNREQNSQYIDLVGAIDDKCQGTMFSEGMGWFLGLDKEFYSTQQI